MGEFVIKCVKVFGHPETQKMMDEAYTCLREQNLGPVWFTEDECFAVNQRKKNEVYIFDVFSGEAFQHIAGLQCRILGPLCVITSLACKKDIPRRLTPVYNLAMMDVIVCCTNIDRERRDPLHEKVEWMGGQAVKDFTEDVTHLIAGNVGSKKYQVAGKFGKKIMLPQWVDEVWKKSKLEAVHGEDEQFQEYKCPIFYGHVITVSGLNAADRAEAKRLIEKEGGTYTGEMKAKECTHLIINEAKGQKYTFAKKWEIHVVKSEWLYESIEKGYCQDEANYAVEDGQPTGRRMQTSTPERRSIAGTDITDISNISAISLAQVNETGCTTVNMTTRLEDPTENLDVTKAPAEMFLDGCKIYLSGFRGATLEKLRKIINLGGGTRFNQITDNLSHVVMGERFSGDLDLIKSLTTKPHVVSGQWLVDCFKQEKHIVESPYLSADVPQQTPKTPELKGVRKKSRVPADDKLDTSRAPVTAEEEKDDMHDIMSQYLTTDQNQPSEATKSNETTLAPVEEDNDLTQDPDATSVNAGEGIFAGKRFVFYGYSEENLSVLCSYVKEHGGTVVKSNARQVPDYAVVPIDGCPVDRTVNDIVSEVWLLMCVEARTLFDVRLNPLFVPIEIHNEPRPLTDCVLSFSGYAGTERDTLVDIALVLGAKSQDYFVRTATKKGLLPSTHLVVNSPEGSKYEAAKKWNIPAVSKLWVLACAKSGKKEPEEIYLIDNVQDDNTLSQNQFAGNMKQSEKLKQTENQSTGNMNQSKHLKETENQSEKNVAQSRSSKIDDVPAEGANTGEDSDSKENGNNMNISNKQQDIEGRLNNESNMPDFSTMGDTEAILAGLDTQGGETTINDNKNKAVSLREENNMVKIGNKNCDSVSTRVGDDTVNGAEDHVIGKTSRRRTGSNNTTVSSDKDETRSRLESDTDSTERGRKTSNDSRPRTESDIGDVDETTLSTENAESRSRIESNEGGNEDDVADDASDTDDEVVIVNKHLQNVQRPQEKKKEETPPRIRFMKNLEKNPPKKGTPGLAKHSVWEKLKGRDAGKQQTDYEFPVDTPPYTKYMRKLEKEPPKLGTPYLSETSARERLKGKDYIGSRTQEIKRKHEDLRQSQKENFETHVQGRLKELKSQEAKTVDKDTPSKFLNPDVRYIPQFNVEEMLKEMETPEHLRVAAAKTRKRKESLDDDKLFELAMKKATKKIEEAMEGRIQGQMPQASQGSQMGDEPDGDYQEPSTVLQGVVITVAKKLTKDQKELNDLVASLGGDYSWNYDSACTHFIFQGRQHDTAKDFKHAKSMGLKIVSPYWLYKCREQNSRVDESLFPHTYNPNLSLSVVSTKRTPLRTPRSSRRTARTVNNAETTPDAEDLPKDVKTDVSTPKVAQTSTPKVAQTTKITIPKAAVVKSSEVGISTPKLSLSKVVKSPIQTSSDDDQKVVAMETGGSLEMREVLSKQLEDLSKTRKRRRSKRLNCSGNVSTPEDPSNSSSRTTRTQENQKNTSARISRGTGEEAIEEKITAEAPPSQHFHVSWDDPMSRLEQAKLAHKLERANSPTQEVGGMYDLDPKDAQYSESEDENEAPVPPFGEQKKVQEKTTPKHSNVVANKTPTPEGPSIAFPVSNKSSKVTPPKPVVVDVDETEEEVPKPPPVFIMSGLSNAEKDDYGALIEQLGGKVLDSQAFDKACTHLVINAMTRNEKFLASIASGKWVLHKSYFEACRQEQRFVEEDFYEWGSEGTLKLIKNMESNVRLLAIAARDWRLKIQEEKLNSPDHYGAFCAWRVLLCCDKSREQNYRRLLMAGGASVLNVKPPYNDKIDATHALIDLNKVAMQQDDLERLLSSGCLCLKPEYISGFLCNPDVDVTEYEPPEITALRTVMSEAMDNTGRKRKASSGTAAPKRSKRK